MNFKGLLRAKGKDIVSEDGNVYILRGLGIGGWLVKEGYMLHSKAPSHSTINAAFKEVLTKKDYDYFIKTYEENYFSEKDLEALKNLGFNSLRVPFHFKNFLLTRNKINPYGFKLLDQIISWCKKHDLYLIIDLHCAPGSQNGQNISDDLSNDAKLYSKNKIYQPVLNFLWEEISKRYVNEKYIAGYDVINEPVLNKENTMEDLKNSYISLCHAIRKYDNNHIIFIEGDRYATKFEGLEPPFDNNMVYSFHKYWNECSINAIQKFLDLREKYNVPLWMSESGENANEWFYLNIKMYEELQIGWNFWTIKKLDNITNIYSIKRPKEYDLLTNYWFNNGPKPTKKKAREITLELLENMKFENLVFLKDVYAATINHKMYENGEPYKEHKLDELILLAHFDIGRPYVSYYKSLYMRDEWNKFDYNKGRRVRNDGIDIHEINHTNYVFFNEKDLFVKYTIKNVKDSKLYLTLKGKGKLLITLNDLESKVLKVNNDEEKTYYVMDVKEVEVLKIKIQVIEKGLIGSYMELRSK